jgi:tellurite resistance protein TerC
MFDVAYRLARRIVIAVVGATVLAVGVAMMVLPGPAFIVIPIGLGILGLEFAWARRWLKAAKDKAEALARSVRSTSTGPGSGSAPPPGTTPQ